MADKRLFVNKYPLVIAHQSFEANNTFTADDLTKLGVDIDYAASNGYFEVKHPPSKKES